MANLSIACLAIDPSNPRVIYAGTGEGYTNIDAIRGAGIFRTVNGTTWTQIPATNTDDFRFVNRIAVSRNGTVVLAATKSGLFRSEDAPRAVWSRVQTGDISDVEFDPADSTKAIAGGRLNGTAYYSTNAGKTWSIASRGVGDWDTARVELAYARANSSIVYASVDVGNGHIWRSADGGKSFEPRSTLDLDSLPAQYLGEQGWYGNTIWAGDPTNADLVIVGGINLWRSLDGGETLIEISRWWDPKSVHADQHMIMSDPRYGASGNATVYFGNDGGIYRTSNALTAGGDTAKQQGWTYLNNGYATTQFYGGVAHPLTGTIVGGAQDNGTLRFRKSDGADKWSQVVSGDGGMVAADFKDSTVFYGEYVYGQVHRSEDGGRTGEFISGQYWDGNNWVWKVAPYLIPDARAQRANFIAPIALDPNNAQRLLVGARSLWRSANARAQNTDTSGPSWAEIKTPANNAYISAIAITPTNSDAIWVCDDSGHLYKTLDGTAAHPIWATVALGTPVPRRYCSNIFVDPKNSKIVFVAFGGYEAGNLRKSVDGGQTWTDVSASLPRAPINSVTRHPAKANLVYAGTEVGLFASEDGGVSWSPTNEGPTNVSVSQLFWFNTTLIAATHGRGMFQIDLSTPSGGPGRGGGNP